MLGELWEREPRITVTKGVAWGVNLLAGPSLGRGVQGGQGGGGQIGPGIQRAKPLLIFPFYKTICNRRLGGFSGLDVFRDTKKA